MVTPRAHASQQSRESIARTPSNTRVVLVRLPGWSDDQISMLQEQTPYGSLVVVDATADAIRGAVAGAHALIACPRGLFTAELLAAAGPTLRWIHIAGAGFEEFCIPELIARDTITLTSGRIIQGPSVADHAVALLLALARNLHYHLRGVTDGLPRPIELRGKTAAIIGCGGIGMLIAERLHACGMDVIGVDAEYVPMVRALRAWYAPAQLHEALAGADAVVVSAPATADSRQMVGPAAFAAMRPSTLFVNVSRGTLVDTAALTAALAAKAIAAAALDVTDPEPLPDDHPLRRMSNVILTPHVAGPSDHNRDRSIELIQENIARFVTGQPLLNRVDPVRGY